VDNYGGKKTDCHLIRCARVWRNYWGDTITKESNDLTMIKFFLLPVVAISPALVVKPLKFLFCPSFCIYFGFDPHSFDFYLL
jgi:hypothetical protein